MQAEGDGVMDDWRVHDEPDRLRVAHRHGWLWVEAEVLADEAGGHWAKCPRCGASVQIHGEHTRVEATP
jgi:hypothetical protein